LAFGFACRVCETRLGARSQHVGKKIKCPDCGALTEVPPPPKPRSPKTPPALEGGEQLDVWPVESQPNASELRAAQLPQVSFECALCDSRLTAGADQVGKAFTCPDCGAKTLVPELPTRPPPVVDPVAVAGAYDLDESAAPGPTPDVVFPTPHERVYETAGDADRGAGLGRPDHAPSTRAVPPKWPLLSGVFTFPFQGGAMVREAFLAGWLVVLAWLFVTSMRYMMAGYAAFIGVCFLAVVTIGSIIWFASASANWIQIVNETSDGNDRISGWPDAVFLDWMFDGFFVVMAAAMAGIPAWAVANFSGLPQEWLWPIVGSVLVAGFPVVLLSMLEVSSPWAILSPKVLASFFRSPIAWSFFYVESAAVATALTFGSIWALRQSGWLIFMVALVVVGGTFVYFRLLGRLGWCIARSARAERSV